MTDKIIPTVTRGTTKFIGVCQSPSILDVCKTIETYVGRGHEVLIRRVFFGYGTLKEHEPNEYEVYINEEVTQ